MTDASRPTIHTEWQRIDAHVEPVYDMTLRQFTATHPDYPQIRVEAASYDLARRAFYQALEAQLDASSTS